MNESSKRIAELNDVFRSTLAGGKVVVTAGVDAFSSDVKALLIRNVVTLLPSRSSTQRQLSRYCATNTRWVA